MSKKRRLHEQAWGGRIRPKDLRGARPASQTRKHKPANPDGPTFHLRKREEQQEEVIDAVAFQSEQQLKKMTRDELREHIRLLSGVTAKTKSKKADLVHMAIAAQELRRTRTVA